MKKKILYIAVILVITSFIGIEFFGNKPSDSPIISVGAILPITGNQAKAGEEIRDALILANEISNMAHKEKINLVIEDSNDDARKGLSAYRKIQQKNPEVVFVAGDTVAFALDPVMLEDKKIMMSTFVGSESIDNEYMFRSWITAEKQARVMSDFTTNNLGSKRVGVIYSNNVFGNSVKDEFARSSKDRYEIVSEESYNIDDTEVRTQIVKVLEANPDLIMVTGYGDAYQTVFKQLNELDWTGPIIADGTLSFPFVFESTGTVNLQNTYFVSTNFDANNPQNEQAENFVAKFSERFGYSPGVIGAFVFDAYNILADEMQSCENSADLIRECLLSSSLHNGAFGQVDFSTRELSVSMFMNSVEDEEVVTVEEFE